MLGRAMARSLGPPCGPRGGGVVRGTLTRFHLVWVLAVMAGCPDQHGAPMDARPDVDRPDAGGCAPGSPCDCRAVNIVPAGTFWRGGPPRAGGPLGAYWSPAHQARHTSAFYLGRYEVTAACFRWCVEVGGCSAEDLIQPAAWTTAVPEGAQPPSDYWRDPFYDDLPAVHLTFGGARDVCATLGGQLPTGAEWEHAARGTQGVMYPWESPPVDPENPSDAERNAGYLDLENAHWGYGRDTLVDFVGRYPLGAAIYGHLDLYGNAAEWTRDGAEPYEGPFDVPLADPVVPATRGVHAVRDWQVGPAYEWVGVNDDGELSADDPLHTPNHAIGARCLFTTEPVPFIPGME